MSIPSAKESAQFGVKDQIEKFIKVVGFGFHPDNDFQDYVTEKGKKSFSDAKSKKLNAQLEECFGMCKLYDLDIYGISIDAMKKLNPDL